MLPSDTKIVFCVCFRRAAAGDVGEGVAGESASRPLPRHVQLPQVQHHAACDQVVGTGTLHGMSLCFIVTTPCLVQHHAARDQAVGTGTLHGMSLCFIVTTPCLVQHHVASDQVVGTGTLHGMSLCFIVTTHPVWYNTMQRVIKLWELELSTVCHCAVTLTTHPVFMVCGGYMHAYLVCWHQG